MVHRLAVVVSHPIQYHAPWFRELASHSEINLEVFFCHKASPAEQSTAGFGVQFDWDADLLKGYKHRFLPNKAAHPSIHSFRGLDTPELFRIIANGRYGSVIVNGWHYLSAWQAMRACWKTKTPVMVRSDSHLQTERGTAKRIAKWPAYRWFIPKLDACLPVGKWSRDYFLHYGADVERVFIIPHVVDDRFFSNEANLLRPERQKFRASWKLPADSTVFLYAGKFLENKRPFDFIEAVARAEESGANVTGLMVGDGPLRRSCEEHVARNRAPVFFAGFLNQSEITKAYVAADALVLPSSGETWGLVVNEAMVCGLPCFVSDGVGCGPDLVTPHETGEIFPAGDIQTLATFMEDFSRNKSLRIQMSNSASRRAKTQSTKSALEATLSALAHVQEIRGRHL